ncbi:MAG TPA: YtxH domain-containing protein [Paracoccaceae bacterium]|nr:YtxH domain-containing protein [Paracoccaceae bacterium]
MRGASLLAVAVMALALAGCGARPADRALSGAGIGAAVGAAGTALAHGHVLTGTLVGAGTGAVIGVLTDPRDVNLGRPLWR